MKPRRGKVYNVDDLREHGWHPSAKKKDLSTIEHKCVSKRYSKHTRVTRPLSSWENGHQSLYAELAMLVLLLLQKIYHAGNRAKDSLLKQLEGKLRIYQHWGHQGEFNRADCVWRFITFYCVTCKQQILALSDCTVTTELMCNKRRGGLCTEFWTTDILSKEMLLWL